MKHDSGCIVCGKNLIYMEGDIDLSCEICQKTFKSNVSCEQNHYVCDLCHSKDGLAIIEDYCGSTDQTNPLEIANDLMKDSRINLHGPEHHFIVPASLLTSYYNLVNPKEKSRKLLVAKERASYIKGGLCGFYGSCGAAMGAGIFASIIFDASPLSQDSWGYANSQTGHILSVIGGVGGPRCCKRNTYISIVEASRFLNDEKNIRLFDYENYRPVCNYKDKNKECIKVNCPFFLNK